MSIRIRIFFVLWVYEHCWKSHKKIRLEANLNQTKFGEIIGVSQDTVSLWEKGKSLPRVEDVIVICKTFDIESDYLLGLKD